MARIKIEELPVMEEMKDEELKGIFGGVLIGLLLPAVQKVRNVRAGGGIERPLVGAVPPNGALVGKGLKGPLSKFTFPHPTGE